ncbi:hypothetical protein NECAME_18756 [Necator americanus]|uniref:Uncharacterized protein n=1 Tax=Necator americanus TaxID=51031 RepID=W2SUW2_NECAM|nr:hypothetical protein NECAME_18756 [Necator americanus]ETN72626.1 hypothetical protein NECAME_18756 [Necator americanus]
MQAKKTKYDVIGLTETRRRHSFNAVYETAEELFLGTYDSRGVGEVGVLVNMSMAKNIDSFEQLTTRTGRLRMSRCGPTPGLTIFVAYAPTSREGSPRTITNWDLFAMLDGFLEDSAMDNIDEEYDRLVEHLHDCAKNAESSKTTKRRLSLEVLELIRQRGAARAAGERRTHVRARKTLQRGDEGKS